MRERTLLIEDYSSRSRNFGVGRLSAGVAAPDEVDGKYCPNCHVSKVVPDDVTITAVSEGLRGYAVDPTNAQALWKKSEEMVGEKFWTSDSTLGIRRWRQPRQVLKRFLLIL